MKLMTYKNSMTPMMCRRIGAAALVLAMAGLSSVTPLKAATTTTTFQVLANVVGVCGVTAVNMNFGTYDPVVTNAITPLDVTGNVALTCNTGLTAEISLNLGTSASGSVRRMAGAPSGFLNYEIYLNAGRTTVWGTTAPNTVVTTAAPSIVTRNYTTYGRIPAAQDVPIGSFADTITVTVTY